MDVFKHSARLVGLLYIAGMVAGIISVVPSIDSENYLTAAAANSTQVRIATLFQFVMFFTQLAIAILLYPVVKKFGESLAIGFLSLRIVSATLILFGTILLISLLVLSQEFVSQSPQNTLMFEALGSTLKMTRDHINHVFMILVLCLGNFMLYVLLLKSKLIPRWLSLWGFLGTVISAIASVLILFQVIDVITNEYLILNVPAALLELVLGLWFLVKGFDKKALIELSR